MKRILDTIQEEMKKKGVTKRAVYNYLEVVPQSLDNYFSNKYPISLIHFTKICELLQLNPCYFFDAEKEMYIETGGQNNNGDKEILKMQIEGLKQENTLLREMLEMYKSR
jgi:hypothetical protein